MDRPSGAGLDETGTAAYFSNKPHVFPGSYFQIAYGAKGPAHAASAWTRPKDGCDDERCRADGGLRWTPSDPLFSEDPLPGVVDGARCSFARPPTQHATGLAVRTAARHQKRWIFRGDESRRGRGRELDIPWGQIAAPPRP